MIRKLRMKLVAINMSIVIIMLIAMLFVFFYAVQNNFIQILEEGMMNTMLQNCIWIGIGSIMGFFIISIFLVRWAVKPVEQAWIQQKQFAADASHELKTPLTVITTNAELLQLPDVEEEKRQNYVQNILHMTKQMKGLVENLLELASMDSGFVSMSLEELDFGTLLNEVILPFEAVFYEMGFDFSCVIEKGIRIKGSETHLKQLVEIFLDNVQNYGEKQGEVEIMFQRVSVKYCLLSVSNTGNPISKEDLKNIFKRFYRGDKTRSMNQNYGLGLSIAQGIAEEHNGKIWAESKDGRNIFYVKLPTI